MCSLRSLAVQTPAGSAMSTAHHAQGDTPKVRNKQKMLEAEGVCFKGSQLADKAFVVTADDLLSHQQMINVAAATN